MTKVSSSVSFAPKQTESSPQTDGATHWEDIYADPAFHALLARKAAFIIPAVAFFVAYYFALLILVGYAPALMERKVVGNINVAYLFALSQFAAGWFLMALYIRRARHFDADSRALTSTVIKGSIR